MPCIPEESLLLLAEDPADQSQAEHSAHLRSCAVCSTRLSDWEGILSGLRKTDPVDITAFDDNYFRELAQDVELSLAEAKVSRPFLGLQARTSSWGSLQVAAPVALAAALLLGILWSRQAPEPTDTVAIQSEPAANVPEAGLEAEARALGRQLLASALEDEHENVYASLQYFDHHDDFMDETAAFVLHSSLEDALHQLDDESLGSLFTQL